MNFEQWLTTLKPYQYDAVMSHKNVFESKFNIKNDRDNLDRIVTDTLYKSSYDTPRIISRLEKLFGLEPKQEPEPNIEIINKEMEDLEKDLDIKEWYSYICV